MNERNRINFIAGFIFIFLLLAGNAIASNKSEKAIWIDVRTAEEYQEGFIAGAVNIPHEEIVAQISTITTDKQAEIHLYCARGKRAGKAKQALEEAGYTNVINAGGYKDIMEKKKVQSTIKK